MPRIRRNALIPRSAEQVFALVNDIEAYPQFMPFCEDAQITERGANQLVARLTLAFAGMRGELTTRNHWTDHRQIDMRLVKGPVKALRGRWVFQPMGAGACMVELDLRFDWQSRLQQAAGQALIAPLSERMVNALCARADALSDDAKMTQR